MAIVTLGLYVGWTFVNCLVADAKGKSMAVTLLASLLCTPFLPYLYLVAVPSTKP